ncbi:MAG: C1 family peptidase, partial [Candidatus Auribacterota bacterium]|nr:C1 family peptidase [Candidatus Auribacterota bacterium]
MSRFYCLSSLTLIAIAILSLFPMGALPAEDGGKLPFEPGDTLEEIRYKIDYNGYDFTVSDNRISRMSEEERHNLRGKHRSRFPGLKAASTGPGPLIGQIGKRALPSSFDWRDHNGHSYIGPVRDQDPCGSCWAFGACAAAEGTYNFAMGFYDGNCADFSESYMMWCLGSIPPYNLHFGGCNNGADWDYYELLALTRAGTTGREGVCSQSNFPYQSTAPASCTPYLTFPRVRFKSWHRVACGDIDAIKTAIMTYGVVDVAVQTSSAFEAYSGGVFQDTLTGCPGTPCYYTTTDHAVSLVGWDDNPPEGGGGCWILRNSWNTRWGENGYMRIRYTSARVACEVAYLVYESPHPAGGDYDGNGTSEITIFRPNAGLWAIRGLTRIYFGANNDLPVPGDYDGSGTTEIGIFRPSSGLWAVRGVTRVYFGNSGDSTVPSDYDGDGTCDPGIFRETSGLWAIRGVTRTYYGAAGDKPVAGDYTGDNTTDIGFFRGSTGLWAVRGITRVNFGTDGDIPIRAGSSITGPQLPAIFRPTSGLWVIRGVTRAYFGSSGDIPVPANYSSTHLDDLAIFRPTSGLWAVRGVTRAYYGSSGDLPV